MNGSNNLQSVSQSAAAAERLSDRKLCNSHFTQFSVGLPRANISRPCTLKYFVREIFV